VANSGLPTAPLSVTWEDGDPVLAPDLRSSVTNTVAFLMAPPAFYGAQTITSQSLGISDNFQPLVWDTENFDNYNGHQVPNGSIQGYDYYSQVPGWYLCACTAFTSGTAATTVFSTGISGQQAGGSSLNHMGQITTMPSGGSGLSAGCLAVKLMRQSVTGQFGGGNDYIQGTGLATISSVTLLNGVNRYPQIAITWVSSLTGTAGLPVPANATWPVPPAYITESTMQGSITDATGFLAYPPLYEAQYSGTSQTLASQGSTPATGTAISLNSETADTWSAGSGGVYTAPAAGLYYCYGQVAGNARSTSNVLNAGLTVDSVNYGGTTTLWGTGQAVLGFLGDSCCSVVQRRVRLNAGDTITLAGFQNDTGSNAMTLLGAFTQAWQSRLIVLWQAA
jgi:hypothetical protein